MNVITWNTSKTDAGYTWRVFTIGHAPGSTTLKSGTAKTRARATGHAKRWCLYFRQVRDRQAAA